MSLESLWQRVTAAHARSSRYRAADDPAYRKALAAFEREVEREHLRELKLAMANSHPDRGGSSERFIKARERYLAAKRRAAA